MTGRGICFHNLRVRHLLAGCGFFLCFISHALAQSIPVFITQPASQTIVVGSNVTFWVTVADGSTPPQPPAVSSGTLQLWLTADTGVTVDGSNMVSLWQDQSGNGNDASQSTNSQEPMLVYPAGLGGRSAIRFNGIQDGVNGSLLFGANTINVPDAMTSFTLYNAFSTTNLENVLWDVGYPSEYGANRICMITGGDLHFSFWAYDFNAPFIIPTNTYRIRTDQLDTNLDTIDMFDLTASSGTNFTLPTDGATTPGQGYYVGGFNPNSAEYVGSSRCFDGDIAEVLVYQGYLSEPDRLAVQAYLQQKYYLSEVNSNVAYQWRFDGTNIANATNATLTLSNAQAGTAGTYSVMATDSAGSVTSSNALLAIGYPPGISGQPQSQMAGLGSSVTFSVMASNTPLSYQWQFDGAKIAAATNSSLTYSGIHASNGGTYSVVITNRFGSITSSNAVLTVVTSAVQVVSAAANGGASAAVAVQLVSAGNENEINFSLDYSNAVLTYSSAALGSNATGAFLVANTSQTNSGHLGLELELPGSLTFALGTQQVAIVTFNIAQITNALVTTLNFGSQPTPESIYNAQFTALPATYANGRLTIAATAVSGDVSPRPSGDGVVLLNDWYQEGRFVAGLDSATNIGEFARADCAPRATGGDGLITVADWVQVGRYAAGFDPPTFVTPRTGAMGTISNAPSASRILSLAPTTQGQLTNIVNLQMAAQGSENAISCSVTFDPTSLNFLGASLGSGVAGAMLDVNTNQISIGNLGLAVALLPGSAIPTGTQTIVQLSFQSIGYSNTTSMSLTDVPVPRQVADTNAAILPVSFQNATLTVAGATRPLLSVSRNGTNILLSWPASATGFTLQSTFSLGQNWTNMAGVPVTNGSSQILTSVISTNSEFFRLER